MVCNAAGKFSFLKNNPRTIGNIIYSVMKQYSNWYDVNHAQPKINQNWHSVVIHSFLIATPKERELTQPVQLQQ